MSGGSFSSRCPVVSEHDVFIGGRSPDKAKALADEIGAVGSGETEEAVRFGSVVVLATPAHAVEDAIESGGGAEAFAGKTVIGINNAVSVPGGPHANEGAEYLPARSAEGSVAENVEPKRETTPKAFGRYEKTYVCPSPRTKSLSWHSRPGKKGKQQALMDDHFGEAMPVGRLTVMEGGMLEGRMGTINPERMTQIRKRRAEWVGYSGER